VGLRAGVRRFGLLTGRLLVPVRMGDLAGAPDDPCGAAVPRDEVPRLDPVRLLVPRRALAFRGSRIESRNGVVVGSTSTVFDDRTGRNHTNHATTTPTVTTVNTTNTDTNRSRVITNSRSAR
jgi:hypothetical protein